MKTDTLTVREVIDRLLEFDMEQPVWFMTPYSYAHKEVGREDFEEREAGTLGFVEEMGPFITINR